MSGEKASHLFQINATICGFDTGLWPCLHGDHGLPCDRTVEFGLRLGVRNAHSFPARDT